MARNEIDEFSDDSIREIAKVVRTLRWQVQNVQELVKAIRRHSPTHEIRTGVTAAKSGGQYPSSGCVLPVQFADTDFPEVAGDCKLNVTKWPSKFVFARNLDGKYIKAGTNVIIVKLAGKKGRRWYIIESGDRLGAISFTLTTDWSGTTSPAGGRIGIAQATVTETIGVVPTTAQSSIQVVFPDTRWKASVKGCKGWALYIDGFYVVVECQELVQGFWGITKDDREPGAPDQDVEVESVEQNVGNSNSDFPRQDWVQHATQPTACSGNAVYTNPTGHLKNPAAWNLTTPCGPGCEPDVPPSEVPVWPEVILPGATYSTACVSTGQQSTNIIKVRYRAGTFPRMVKGAIFYCTLDNDITNVDDNSTMRYYVEVSQELPELIHGNLPETNCGFDFSVNGVAVDSDWPHNQPIPADRLPLLITNPHGHQGLTGFRWTARWSKTDGNYVMDDVLLAEYELAVNPIDVTDPQTGCRTLSVQKQKFAIETCHQPEEGWSYAFKTETVHRFKRAYIDDGQSGSGSGAQCSPSLKFEFYAETAYVTCDSDSTLVTDSLPLLSKNVVVALDMDGCPIWSTQSIFVMGVCPDLTIHEADCDPCPPPPPE
jgi:hypothetical protein